ncbi:MAG: class IV adenylate cyclase [Candidatus Omnitrophica bacterium]|nr:class IV adenylate cyclase [Candidatus Omnitrophota bacterium]MBU4478780.1 class IV adenylate cyclase [Candidatus Omnitrophota bacterium]MCG2704079.1 class IV adenylate cyclase [Candidatus Omnitrophota bacterium]
MKKIFKLISFVLIQTFLVTDFTLAAEIKLFKVNHQATSFLSPAINMGLDVLRGIFQSSASKQNDLSVQLLPPAPLNGNEEKISNEEFFYSDSLGSYISRRPLKVDASVVQAAARIGIKLEWDDAGRIGSISFYNARRLLKELGMEMMSHREYWQILREACIAGDREMVRELLSDKYAEWLDVIFIKKNDKYYMVEHPAIKSDGTWDKQADRQKMQEIDMPEGRHAWFQFEEDFKDIYAVIDEKMGFPYKERVDKQRKRGSNVLKFWDVYTDLAESGVGAIRGYVTSSGTPSLDCAIPLSVDNAPLLMLRGCCKELPQPPIASTVLERINSFIKEYDSAMEQRQYALFYDKRESLFSLLSEQFTDEIIQQVRTGRENSLVKVREKISDMLGFLKLYAVSLDERNFAGRIDTLSRNLFGVSKNAIDFDAFRGFIRSSRSRLNAALKPGTLKPIVFVMGHKAPDTDTVISSLFEAYRNHLINPDVVYIPVVQAGHIPDEVKLLLNDPELSDSILLFNENDYKQARESGQANWILVDQNVSEVQKFVISILDHHTAGQPALDSDVAKTIEIAGSTTGMVAQRFNGMGLSITGEMARICYGATLMDTENKNPSKMTLKDQLVMDSLRLEAGIDDGAEAGNSTVFYQTLMSALLNTDDAEHLFVRDYKQDWGFGFAVAKMKCVFDRQSGAVKKKDVLERLIELARQNNRAYNFPVTLVKVVDYEEDNETVYKERMYFVFNDDVQEGFKKELFDLLKTVIKKQFSASTLNITEETDFIEWQGVKRQLSRKKIAPVLQPVVEAFNTYFYSKELDLYVRREFLKITDRVKEKAAELGIELSENENGYVNYVSPYEFMQLMQEMGSTILSLKEYSMVRSESRQRNDSRMVATLESPGFVEVLDTVVLDYDPETQRGDVIEHPRIERDSRGGFRINGEIKRQMHIPAAKPGLIDLDDVNPKTGFPDKVFYFGDDISHKKGKLSRYWSPYGEGSWVFTRGSIFMYRIPCIDGKVRPDEIQTNLGVRPCRKKIDSPKIFNAVMDGKVFTKIINEEGVFVYKDGLLQKDNSVFPFEDITGKIREKLLPVDAKEHSLDIGLYLKNMISAEVLAACETGTLGRIELHYAPMHYLKEANSQLLDGYEDISFMDPDGCSIGWFVKEGASGTKDIVITDVRGKSKLMHILYGLRLLGVGDDKVCVYDYGFDFEKFAAETINNSLSLKDKADIVAVGKSVFGRKLLRKIKFGKIYLKLKEDMRDAGFDSVEKFLKVWIIAAAANKPAAEALFPEFFQIPFVSDTVKKMQSIIDEPLGMKELLVYWYYGDIVEDFVRIITTLNTRTIEITKFVKMLPPQLAEARLSGNAVLFYEEQGGTVSIDLSDYIRIENNKDISFNPQVTQHLLEKELKDFPAACAGIKHIFGFVTMFSGLLNVPLTDYTLLPDLAELRKKFDLDVLEKSVIDINVLKFPLDADLSSVGSLPVGGYPFGELAADFVCAAIGQGAKRYVHAGSCGIFVKDRSEIEEFNLRAGDLVVPEAIYDKQGNFLSYLNARKIVDAAKHILDRSRRPYRVIKRSNGKLEFSEGVPLDENPAELINIIITNHTSVDSPLEEDFKCVQTLQDAGMGSVDCETAKVVERMLSQRVYFDYEFMFWVSDVPGEKGATLAAEKELHPITHDTRLRKVQGLMSDIFMYLRFKEQKREEIAAEEMSKCVRVREQVVGTVEDAIAEIEKRRREKKRVSDEGFSVLVSGLSASGKTSRVAKVIAGHFGCNEILSQDHYYLGKKFMDAHGFTNYDDPRVVELSRYGLDIAKAKKKQPFKRPVYVFTEGGKRVGEKDFYPDDAVVGEGNFVLVDEVAEQGDFNIFVKVVEIGQMIRRIKRDVIEGRTGQTFREALIQLFTQVLPAQKEFLEPTAKNADMIIYSYYDAEKEAPGIGSFELQAKVKMDNGTIMEALEDKLLGAEKIAEDVIQNDVYYTPRDRSLFETTGEILRLREQNGKRSLTYKGPLMDSKFRNKPKLEMPFERELIPYLEQDYKVFDRVKKIRSVYRLGDLIVNFDQVEGLGCFIEVSLHQTERGKEDDRKIQMLLEKLGFAHNDIIRESYLELSQSRKLMERFKSRDDTALIFLKGAEQGGLHPQVKARILAQLSQWFEIVEGEEHAVSFREMIDRWGTGYFKYHFLEKIKENQRFPADFVGELEGALENRDEKRFNAWLEKAKELAQEDGKFLMQLLVYEYYSGAGEQLLLKLKDGVNLDKEGKSLQTYVKEKIIGATFCYDADFKQSRGIIKKELQGGVLRPVMEKALAISGKRGYEAERFISSIFNGIHRADFGPELELEFKTLTNADIAVFNRAFDKWEAEESALKPIETLDAVAAMHLVEQAI